MMIPTREKGLTDIWEDAVVLLKERIPPDIYETWFKDLSIDKLSENELILSVPNRFFRDWIRDRYHNVLEQIFALITKNPGLRTSYLLRDTETPARPAVNREPER